MQALFSPLPGLVKMSLEASVLILLVLAAQGVCGRHLKPRWRYALWILVLLRLALPWTIPSPVSLFNVSKLHIVATHTQPEIAPAQTMDAPISNVEGAATTVSSATGHWLAWVWAAGALLLTSCAVINQYKFRRRLARQRPLTGENEAYGLTIVKLLEGFGQSDWGPSLAGILEDKQQMKERIKMITKFHKADRGLALAVSLLVGLTLTTLTDAQNQTQPPPAKIGKPDASKGVWAVRFEPVGDFSPKTPGEFLSRIHIYSGQHGEIGYFRTKKQGDKLIGSFLAYDGDQLKAALAKVPGLKVTSVEKLTQQQLLDYEKSRQESLVNVGEPDASKGVWAVRFEPVGDFSPKTPGEFLSKIHIYSGQHGEIGYFRTKKQGDKLIGSFLAYDGNQLKAALAKVPGLKVTSVEKLTQEQLLDYEKSPQESL